MIFVKQLKTWVKIHDGWRLLLLITRPVLLFHSSWPTWLIPAIAATVVGIVCRYYMFDHKSSWVPFSSCSIDLEAFQCWTKTSSQLDCCLKPVCVSCAARERGGSLTECSWGSALGLKLHSLVCLHFYCLSLSLWLFPIMLNKGAELKPLPAGEPDTRTRVPPLTHTYWRCKALNSKNKYLLRCQSVAFKMIFYRESFS